MLFAVGLQQAARDLEPRGLGLALADQPARTVLLDLAELITIDHSVERLAPSLTRFRDKERPQQDVKHDCREASEDDPKQQGR
jgi:hypothetical protein